MRQFRYPSSASWLKGNTHIHSTASDGGLDFPALAALYADAGYDFLFRTDHWVLSDTAGDTGAYPLLWLDGVELHGTDQTGAMYHVAVLGRVIGLRQEEGLLPAMAAARKQGALLILAHPHWCANTLDDARRHHFDGVEVYNHVCRWLNGKGDGGVYWTTLLERNNGVLGWRWTMRTSAPSTPAGTAGGSWSLRPSALLLPSCRRCARASSTRPAAR
jgi:hypothetical protein